MLAVRTATRPRAEERARGLVHLSTTLTSTGTTRVDDLRQEGSGRVLFPRALERNGPLEAVIVNVGGGIAGGDRFACRLSAGEGSHLSVTTQACEKVYRSDGRAAFIDTRLKIATGARIDWLPQETILFDQARLSRKLSVDLASAATCLLVEAVILGRQAMGESLTAASLADSWRIRREGRLIFAEETRLGGDLSALASPSGLGGRTCFASVILAGPNAAIHLDGARRALAGTAAEGGASMTGEVLVCRLIAHESRILRAGLTALIRELSGREPPRVWHT